MVLPPPVMTNSERRAWASKRSRLRSASVRRPVLALDQQLGFHAHPPQAGWHRQDLSRSLRPSRQPPDIEIGFTIMGSPAGRTATSTISRRTSIRCTSAARWPLPRRSQLRPASCEVGGMLDHGLARWDGRSASSAEDGSLVREPVPHTPILDEPLEVGRRDTAGRFDACGRPRLISDWLT